jgi:hypothetical protein
MQLCIAQARLDGPQRWHLSRAVLAGKNRCKGRSWLIGIHGIFHDRAIGERKRSRYSLAYDRAMTTGARVCHSLFHCFLDLVSSAMA